MAHEPDMLLPPEMALAAEAAGVRKANLPMSILFMLAVLAGAFIALGAAFAQVVMLGNSGLWGISRLLGGVAFSIGLVLVIFSGAELFTGNNLLVMAYAGKKITAKQILRNWGIVFMGNAFGAVSVAFMLYLSGYAGMHDGALGNSIVSSAVYKASLNPLSAFLLGVLCNVLVCLAVWISFSALDAGGKLWCIIFPVTAFVTCGFEHVIANLYVFPFAYFLKLNSNLGGMVNMLDLSSLQMLQMGNIFRNLFFVLLGNLFGGVFLVGIVYWFIYLKPRRN